MSICIIYPTMVYVKRLRRKIYAARENFFAGDFSMFN